MLTDLSRLLVAVAWVALVILVGLLLLRFFGARGRQRAASSGAALRGAGVILGEPPK